MPRVILLGEDAALRRLLAEHGHEVLPVADSPDPVRSYAEALEFNHSLLSASGLAVAVYAEDGSCLFANEALARTVGGTREQLLRQNFRTNESWRRWGLLEMAERTLSTGEDSRGEVYMLTTFGRHVWLECHAAVMSSGGRRHLLMTARDVTEQRVAEAALRVSEEKYRTLMSSASDGIFLADAETGVILDVNRKGEELVGAPASEIVGLHQSRLHPPEEEEQHRVGFRRHAMDGDLKPLPGLVLHRSGRQIPVEVNATLLDLGGKKVVMGIFRDLTERERAEAGRRELEARVQQARMLEGLGLLAGGIAHDFNNLLVSILANADLVARGLPATSTVREPVEDILTASRDASDLCRQLLAYAGKGNLVTEPVDLRMLLEEMARVLRASLPKSVTLTFRFADGVPTLRADATQVRQVILNLIKNAAEAIGDDEGVVTLSTGVAECSRAYLSRTYVDDGLPEGPYAWFEVTDTGCGMDAETRSRMLDPFFSTKFTGRGLGMAAVLGIVRGHGGAIEVESEPSRGTRIRVLFPVQSGPAEAPSRPAAAETTPLAANGPILLVDDDEGVRRVGKRILEGLGLQVVTASGGRQAVDLLRQRKGEIACVLLDLAMPGMDGLQTLPRLRRVDPSVPVVISSGYDQAGTARRIGKLGVEGFLEKPFSVSCLEGVLRSILSRRMV